MANVAIIGAQWGDEGKGKIVDWLSSRADVVVRFQGGHNAGHTLVIDGVEYLLEKAITGDLSIIKAWKGDESGNLVFRKAARNFNPPMAKAGKICVVEVEQLVKTGELDPDHIHLPGIYVDRIFEGKYTEKKIEFVTLREE